MKYARFEYQGAVYEGSVEKNVVLPIQRGRLKAANAAYDIDDVKLLPPAIPSKIIAVGLNYSDHADEFNLKAPKEPLIFLKPATSIIGPGAPIYFPAQCMRLDYEAEMAIVIKQCGRNIPRAKAKDYIFGYTCLNDVTARDLQKQDGQWTRSKSFDTFCPIGPYIATDIDASSLKIESFLNGKIRQSSSTSKMIFSCEVLVEFISGIMTLEAGDVIATGTPAGIGPMAAGDIIEVRIEKIGSLVNEVRDDSNRQRISQRLFKRQ